MGSSRTASWPRAVRPRRVPEGPGATAFFVSARQERRGFMACAPASRKDSGRTIPWTLSLATLSFRNGLKCDPVIADPSDAHAITAPRGSEERDIERLIIPASTCRAWGNKEIQAMRNGKRAFNAVAPASRHGAKGIGARQACFDFLMPSIGFLSGQARYVADSPAPGAGGGRGRARGCTDHCAAACSCLICAQEKGVATRTGCGAERFSDIQRGRTDSSRPRGAGSR